LRVAKPQQEVSKMSLLELFCAVDDFCQEYATAGYGRQLGSGHRRRKRQGDMDLSEVMTLLIHFHQSHYRDFKAYYTEHVRVNLRREFPTLVSYGRFVERMPRTLVPLGLYIQRCMGQCTGLSFIDSTALPVSHNRRIHAHRVFEGLAERGKTSMGWFYGFKLHLVVNDCGDLLAFCLTAGNVDDRQAVPRLAKRLFGKLFGDKGYISQKLFDQLFTDHALQLITKLRKNMKAKLMLYTDRLLLRRRAIIETINDQLKNISQIQHSRHRSPINFLVNLLAGLIAYCWQPKKPSIGILRHADLVIA
jgi:hypothetical protein